jgi:signal transduction histidine kinase
VTALTKLIASFPFRLTVAYMGAFVLAAALIVLYIAWQANELLTSKAIDALTAEVASLRTQFQAGGPERLASAIRYRVGELGSGLYLLVDGAGNKRAGNLPAIPSALVPDGQGQLFSYRRAAEGEGATERFAVGLSVSVSGGYTLVVARDIEDQRQFAATIGRVALWSFGLLSLLGVGAGILISRSMLARIEAVTETSRKIMAGDLSRRIALSGSGDELDRLAESLNAMLARIEELLLALREVSDNIAHDLKTPLNRLRNRAEAALRGGDGPDAYRDGLAKTIEEADELIKTFNSLLLIARLEGGAIAESMAALDPAAIIGDIAELYEPAAEEAGLALAVSAQQGLAIVANRELVSQAVANLVDNAIKYSAAPTPAAAGAAPSPPAALPGVITISLTQVGRSIEIAVGDRGPGVAPQDRERALQRFVRLEKARSLPGAGLGLSLVAAVARMHGGTVRLEDNAPGLRVILSLPADAPRPAYSIPVPSSRPERTSAEG